MNPNNLRFAYNLCNKSMNISITYTPLSQKFKLTLPLLNPALESTYIVLDFLKPDIPNAGLNHTHLVEHIFEHSICAFAHYTY